MICADARSGPRELDRNRHVLGINRERAERRRSTIVDTQIWVSKVL